MKFDIVQVKFGSFLGCFILNSFNQMSGFKGGDVKKLCQLESFDFSLMLKDIVLSFVDFFERFIINGSELDSMVMIDLGSAMSHPFFSISIPLKFGLNWTHFTKRTLNNKLILAKSGYLKLELKSQLETKVIVCIECFDFSSEFLRKVGEVIVFAVRRFYLVQHQEVASLLLELLVTKQTPLRIATSFVLIITID